MIKVTSMERMEETFNKSHQSASGRSELISFSILQEPKYDKEKDEHSGEYEIDF